MSCVVSIHQPAYLPWLGYFDKIKRSDKFIYLDTVQFQKNSFQNRNKIRTPQGSIWLTVPVRTSGALYDTALKDLPIDNATAWQRKHLGGIQGNYARARSFDIVIEHLRPFYLRDWDRLSGLCFEMLSLFLRLLDIATPVVKASDLPPTAARKSDLVLDLCRRAGATHYLSGSLGRDYLDVAAFSAAGISVEFQDYAHPTYTQAFPGFLPFMGVIDLLMCETASGKLI
jgi:hypothetical protein